jgi:hypothetical protein
MSQKPQARFLFTVNLRSDILWDKSGPPALDQLLNYQIKLFRWGGISLDNTISKVIIARFCFSCKLQYNFFYWSLTIIWLKYS